MSKSKDNVVKFNGITKLDMPAKVILREAQKHGLESVVLMGYDADGEEYFASSIADGGEVLWLSERLKKRILEYPETL